MGKIRDTFYSLGLSGIPTELIYQGNRPKCIYTLCDTFYSLGLSDLLIYQGNRPKCTHYALLSPHYLLPHCTMPGLTLPSPTRSDNSRNDRLPHRADPSPHAQRGGHQIHSLWDQGLPLSQSVRSHINSLTRQNTTPSTHTHTHTHTHTRTHARAHTHNEHFLPI